MDRSPAAAGSLPFVSAARDARGSSASLPIDRLVDGQPGRVHRSPHATDRTSPGFNAAQIDHRSRCVGIQQPALAGSNERRSDPGSGIDEMGLRAGPNGPLQEPVDRTQPCHVEEGQVTKIDDQRIFQAEPVNLMTKERHADTIERTDQEQTLDAVPALEPNREEFFLRCQRAPLTPCLASPIGSCGADPCSGGLDTAAEAWAAAGGEAITRYDVAPCPPTERARDHGR